MADENANQDPQTKLPGTEGAPAAGADGTPAAGAAPAAGAKPPAAKPPQKPAAKPPAGKPAGGPQMVTMPSNKLRERIDRDAAAKIKRVLGCTLEEAKAKLAAAGSAPAAIAAAGGAPAAPAGTDPKVLARLDSVERQNKDLRGRLDAQKKKTDKVKSRERDRRTSLELRYSAVAAGVADEHADFALDQFAKAIRSTPAGQDPPAPSAYWPTLLKKHPYLGKSTPPEVVDLRGTTAPPESRQPGEAKPAPAGAGTPPQKVDVDKMSDEEFQKHAERNYRFRVPA